MIITVSFVHTLFGMPYTAITDNEYIAKLFVAQIEGKTSAITLGVFNNLSTQPTSEPEVPALKYHPDVIKIIKSKTNPEIQILGTDCLMEIYEDRMSSFFADNLRELDYFALIDSVCRKTIEGYISSIKDISHRVRNAIATGEIDLVRLSLNTRAHFKPKPLQSLLPSAASLYSY